MTARSPRPRSAPAPRPPRSGLCRPAWLRSGGRCRRSSRSPACTAAPPRSLRTWAAAAARRVRGRRSLVRQAELAAGAMGAFRDQVLERGIGREALALDVLVTGSVEHERLIRADLVPELLVAHHLALQRA